MGSEQAALNIIYATAASRQLREIWEWNAKRYGKDHADEYWQFLLQSCRTLLKNPSLESRLNRPPA